MACTWHAIHHPSHTGTKVRHSCASSTRCKQQNKKAANAHTLRPRPAGTRPCIYPEWGIFFSLLFKSWGKEESYLKKYLGTCLQRWDAGIVTEKRDQRKTVWREMDSAVLSINYNLIPNGDTFGILDNMSEFVQKSIKSSWHYRTYKNVSLMEWKKKRRSSSKQEGARTSTHLLNLSSLHVVPSS